MIVSTQASSASADASRVRTWRSRASADDVGQMVRLLVQHVREVGREARLPRRDDEQVGEAAHMEAVEGLHAVFPLLDRVRPSRP